MRNGVPSRNEHFELHQKMLPNESLLFVGYVIKKALLSLTSLRKQPAFCNATTGYPSKWRFRNKRRNSMLMTGHYPDLGSASDWLKICFHRLGVTTHICLVTRHQYGNSALVSRTSFRGETSCGVVLSRLFSQVSLWYIARKLQND